MKIETREHLIDMMHELQSMLTKLGADLIEMEEDSE